MSDWADDPQAQQWVQHVLDELLPMIEDSAITVSIVPHGPADVKFAVELGLSIMLDKPIILTIPPGARIPDHLRRVADDIVDLGSAETGDRIKAALERLGGS
ncbi:hypothetical protein [Gryllotalpicola protaetiae]|uniref:Uncharacterized protein n=1 Tax=Gryllotalpicola protaetiae TaxID=2419771 RepID=A0A387BEK8_9MICO|nr:hypothetical protein [Gryllotalpicola protaetiae]AYG02405.1 hypothetical protein D7I44_01870 [Gryllotalpicola protaetiae]